MEGNKIFCSDIVKGERKLNNNLYELLEIVPAKPVLEDKLEKSTSCDFIPKTGKCFAEKKRSNLKVQTVRNLRELLENDVYEELNTELEKNKNMLLRKIKIGSSKEEPTRKLAKTMLHSSSPICKDVWQMLTNLNPEGHSHAAQFVLYNHNPVQINGSKGGKTKFISNFDVGRDSVRSLNSSSVKVNKSRRKEILSNSLLVRFKPGPLSRKRYLDTSYQKYQYGDSTIVSLPKTGLDVQSMYGTPLSATMNYFLSENFMRNPDGEITKKWAEFSLSVLGTNKRGSPVQLDKSACTSFDLLYKCNQNRILMRDATGGKNREIVSDCTQPLSTSDEVNSVLNKILDYVEIKLDQEHLLSKEEESNGADAEVGEKPVLPKDKVKRKFNELDRLDVTIIKLSGEDRENTECAKDHCSLGCICNSLECSFNLKTHCGRIDCMFECKCINSKQWLSTADTSLNFAGIQALNKKLNSGLAKEEQKFRQTVVLSGDKSILLKSQRRHWKSSKRYAEFYSSMCLKTESVAKKVLLILVPKINYDNIKPWCMVHNLYNCFCKCKFTERKSLVLEQRPNDSQNVEAAKEPTAAASVRSTMDPPKTRSSLRLTDSNKNIVGIEDDDSCIEVSEESFYGTRVTPFTGRKHTDEYYLQTNRKISEMEKNDRTLVKKMASLMQTDIENKQRAEPPNSESTPNEMCLSRDFFKQLPYNPKMIAWMIARYKHCKQCKGQGKVEKFLKPPHLMRFGFYTWEFILSRYLEKKNFFLISPQKPYKILLAINRNHQKLRSFINVSDLNLDDIDSYPNEVQYLMNSTDRKDTFWILRGLDFCWELYGVVKKLNEKTGDEDIVCSLKCDENESLEFSESPLNICYGFSDDESEDSAPEKGCVDVDINNERIELNNDDLMVIDSNSFNLNKIVANKDDATKWFLMFVESDFSELHFYKRGFFVHLDYVLRTMAWSWDLKKTVKMYCKKYSANSHFGIYAIPNKSSYVVIGPYALDEVLNIEVVQSNRLASPKSRGTWISVPRENILKLLCSPLSYAAPSDQLQKVMVPLYEEATISKEKITQFTFLESDPESTPPKTEQTKGRITTPIKPIRIRKSEGFFCVYQKGGNPAQNSKLTIIRKDSLPKSLAAQTASAAAVDRGAIVKPVRIAPRPAGSGMSVLKPEEINKRVLEQRSLVPDDSLDLGAESVLATGPVPKLPDVEDEVLLISDEESEDVLKDVWIQSKNVPSLGWIPGKLNNQGQISFEFPGLKNTKFYDKNVAFRMINLVLSRKVFVHKRLKTQWETVERFEDLRSVKKLEASDLDSKFTLTKQGLKSREEVLEMSKKRKSQTNCK